MWGAAQALAFGAGGLLGTGLSDLARLLLASPAVAYAAVFAGGGGGCSWSAAWLAAGLFGRRRHGGAAHGDVAMHDRETQAMTETFDAVVVGGGPAGATAADDLARQGRSVLLLDRAGRIKPCGGAIPPVLVREFAIPEHLIVARGDAARGSCRRPDSRRTCRSSGGYVGMVDREVFDEWLRERAERGGRGAADGHVRAGRAATRTASRWCTSCRKGGGGRASVRARAVIGADGAKSAVAKQCVQGRRSGSTTCSPITRSSARRRRRRATTRRACDIYYQSAAVAGFLRLDLPARRDDEHRHRVGAEGLRRCARRWRELRRTAGLDGLETIRREGAPIPLRPMKRWDNGRDVVLAGDAAGVVAPASGEGIYYAMLGGRLAAEAVEQLLRHRRRARAADGAAAVHEGAWPGVPGARLHAVVLVCDRQAARDCSSSCAATRTCSG